MVEHLAALERIADGNGEERSPPRLARVAPRRRSYRRGRDFRTLRYSPGGQVTGAVEPIDPGPDSGCQAADFRGFERGRVALLTRGTCRFDRKVANAEDAGAVAVLVSSDGRPGRRAPVMGSLEGPGRRLPALSLSSAVGRDLRATPGTRVQLQVSTTSERRRTHNVIAETGSEDDARAETVMAGAHLDSVPDGSRRYVRGLSRAQRRSIVAYLNFDMVGSANAGRFVYSAGEGEHSERIERLLRRHFAARGLATRPTDVSDASDHAPFLDPGIPVGGLYSGATLASP